MGYDPYFSIGDAVAALGIFLLIPQFLKPIYLFRLRVIGIGLRSLYGMSALGFICVTISALCAQIPSFLPGLFGQPLLWEIVASILFSVAYGVLGWVYMFPPRAGMRSIDKYVRAGANFLAGANEDDRIEFAADILVNIRRLIRIADMTGASEPPKPVIAADERKRTEPSERAAYAESFLRVLSDPLFCRTLAEKLPWDGARILRAFSEAEPSAPVGRPFVRQIARHALICAEAGSAKAVDWHSFTDAPALATAAFGNAYLNRHYLPWECLEPEDFRHIDAAFMERIQRAAHLTIDEQIKTRFSYQSYDVAAMQENFEGIARRIAALKHQREDATILAGMLGRTVKYIIDATREYCRNASPEARKAMYVDPATGRDSTSFNSLAELIISVLEHTSHDFSGFDDKFWPMARDIWDSILPRFGSQPAGMDPLQQRFVLKLIEKTKENLEGWYSSVPRQALAIIGPYAAKGESKERTAFKICRDMFYLEMKDYGAFYERDAERAKTFLPGNVRYIPETTSLVHRYSFGGEDSTDIGALVIAPLTLSAETVGQFGSAV